MDQLILRASLGCILASMVFVMGCGETCQSTCDHVYRTCNIEKTGQSVGELVRDCESECENALLVSGEIEDYDPNSRRLSDDSVTLQNDTQAAAWIDCVWQRAPDGTPEQCGSLDPRGGFCAPI